MYTHGGKQNVVVTDFRYLALQVQFYAVPHYTSRSHTLRQEFFIRSEVREGSILQHVLED